MTKITTSPGITATAAPAPGTTSPGITTLHRTFKKFGSLSLMCRQKCIGMLPEINRLRVYEKKGFGTIFEYAAKLAGISREQVQRVLRLERRFEDKPVLKNALVKGEISVNKLARIASVATAENQNLWTDHAKNLSQKAVEILVKEYKNATNSSSGYENQNGLFESKNECDSVRAHGNFETRKNENEINIKLIGALNPDIKKQLVYLAEKGIDINELISETLKKREQKITEEKAKIAAEIEKKIATRHIPAHVKRIIRLEHGTKCSIPHCNRPAAVIHHTQRFALARNHDPRYLAPLCREHHQIAHSVDTVFSRRRSRISSSTSD